MNMRGKCRRMAACMTVGALLYGALGCASGSGTKQLVRESNFTKPEELAKIQQRPVSSETLPSQDGLRVEEWTLTGELPSRIALVGLQAPRDDLEGALLEGVARSKAKNMRATKAMSCAAHQMAAFMIEHDAQLPDESLQTFIRHRCGSLASSLSSTFWQWDLSPGQTLDPEKLPEEFYSSFKEQVTSWSDEIDAGEVGVALAQRDGEAIVVLTAGYRAVVINAIDMVPAQDRLVIEGELFQNVSTLGGSITRGDFGAETCVTDSRVKLPEFRVTCPIQRGDVQQMFELYSHKEGNIFQSRIFDQRIWPAGTPHNGYASSAIRKALRSGEAPTGTREEIYLAYVNRVREAAGKEKLTHEVRQSQAAKALAPNYFEANRKSDDASKHKILMGLLAGWEVNGDILDGGFLSRTVSDGSMASLMEDILDNPSGRSALLSEDTNAFAVGEIQEGESNLGAVVLVYEFLPEETYIRRLARAWRTLNLARKLSKKKPFKRGKKVLSKAEKISAQMASGALSYDEGVERFQAQTSAAYGNSGVYTYTYLTHDLDDFSLPPKLLDLKGAEANVMVTPLDIDGYPWTIYSVVLVFPTNRIKE